jgi:hypothetical protein
VIVEGAVSTEEFARLTGWALKPEGACRGELCVPLPRDAVSRDGTIELHAVAGALGMPVVADPGRGLTALGPATLNGRAISTAQAPDPALTDLAGHEFRLSSLRGQKVLLIAWAPY